MLKGARRPADAQHMRPRRVVVASGLALSFLIGGAGAAWAGPKVPSAEKLQQVGCQKVTKAVARAEKRATKLTERRSRFEAKRGGLDAAGRTKAAASMTKQSERARVQLDSVNAAIVKLKGAAAACPATPQP